MELSDRRTKTMKNQKHSRTKAKRQRRFAGVTGSALWIDDEWHVFRKRDPENPVAGPWTQWAGPFWTKDSAEAWKQRQPWPAKMEMIVGRRAILDAPND